LNTGLFKLDILLPFYGDVGYFKETVLSVLNQDSQQWSLVIIDDAYPDPSIALWVSDLDCPKIKYVRNETNLGANANYRKALEFIDSDFCVILGADDLLKPNFVSTVHSSVESNSNFGLLQPGVEVIDELGKPINPIGDRAKSFLRKRYTRSNTHLSQDAISSLCNGNWLYFPSIVWRSSLIKEIGFREGLNVCQDLDLAFGCISRGEKLIVSDDLIFSYRRHSGSDSSVKAVNGERFKEEKRFYYENASVFSNSGWKMASFAARLHLTSRLNALSLVPKAIRLRANPYVLIKHFLT
jgi:glycosyltransferase involved in cell wall biosynthesis